MFLRIYLGILSSIVLAALASYLMYSQINELRLERYNKKMLNGIFSLIQSGAARHEGDKRDQWLTIVSRISGLNWQRVEPSLLKLSSKEKQLLTAKQIIYRAKDNSGQFEVIGSIPNDASLLQVKLKSLEEQQLRAPALLILNELGIVEDATRPQQLKKIAAAFEFNIQILGKNELKLDTAQLKRLLNGDVVVSWQSDIAGDERLMVYANYSGGEQFLVLGPIPRFNESPVNLMAGLLAFCLLLTAGIAYTLVFRLESRLKGMMAVVKKLGPNELELRVETRGSDTIAELGQSFNEMTDRLDGLLKEQKHIIQAVSHDLRTPISRLQFRLSSIEGDENSKAILGMDRDIKELNTLVDEILFYHKIDPASAQAQLSALPVEQVNIGNCFSELAEKTSTTHPEKTLEFEGEQNIEVSAYNQYLSRLLQNLTTNALKYASSKVIIRFYQDDSLNHISVEDDGEGLAKEYWQSIFQPFTRVETSRNKELGGHGLGLAIVQRIAEMHSGTVKAGDSSLGGAQFTFSWPINYESDSQI